MRPMSKTVQALKAMKSLGYSEKSVRPVVKELLRLYEDNWTLIEDDGYRVLVEAILNGEEQKAHVNELKRPNASSLEDIDEENEPLKKKPKRGNAKKQASPSAQKIRPRKNYDRKKKTNSGSPQSRLENEQETEILISDDESNEFNKLKTFGDVECFEGEHSSHHSFPETGNPSEYRPLAVDEKTFEVPLAVIPPDSPTLILEGASHDNCYIGKESCSTYPEVIDLDSDDECTTDDLHPKDCDLETNYSEQVKCKDPEPEEVKHDPCLPLKLDVASSSSGEAKIFLMVNPSAGPGFRVPTLEAMLEKVKEHCLETYKIPRDGFSLLGIMKEVCESFLEAGTTSNPRPADEMCIPKETNLEIITRPAVLNDPVIEVQSPFEFSPRIPRYFSSVDLDLIRCSKSFNQDLAGCVSMLKKGEPSSGGEVAIIIKKQRLYRFIDDITKGHESREVSLINEVNGDEGPTFHYISKNATYRKANLSFPLARVSEEDCCSDCIVDCLSVETPCTCAGKTGFKFAYTPKGLVRESFLDSFVSKSRSLPPRNLFYCQDCPFGECNGHVRREFIKECWHKCGCGMKCGNRVVQRGITAKLQVFMTAEGKGWGLRTLEDMPKGAFICEYVGEVVTIKELIRRSKKFKAENGIYLVVLDGNWGSKHVLKGNEALCLDATAYGNVARFINHRCFDANMVGIPVEVESPDRHYYHFAFFTTREVNAFEELTWDYGMAFGESLSMKYFQCLCGSKFCRDHGTVKG